MADLEAVMKSHSPPRKYLAVYDDPKTMDQFRTLCLQYEHRYTPCNGIHEAKRMLMDRRRNIDSIAIDIRLVEQNRFEFLRFLIARSCHIQVHVTYDDDRNDSIVKSRLENVRKHIQESRSKTITTTRWSIINTNAATSSHPYENGGLRLSDSKSVNLAAFKNPQYKSAVSTELTLALQESVSTELTLGLPGTGSESITEKDSNKRKRIQ